MAKSNIGVSPHARLVLKAINNPKYKARTVNGIAKELQLSADVVVKVISGDLRDQVISVPGVRKNNEPLYVTIDRYKKRTPLAVRILNKRGQGLT